MENTLHAISQAGISPAPITVHPALQKYVVPVAPTCFLLEAGAGSDIGALSAHIHEIAKTYHAYGALNLTFIISDAQALNATGFFTPEHQRVLLGDLAIDLRYLFASELGVVPYISSFRTQTDWAKYFPKEGAH
ncbi:MAG: hypothetical protein ACOH2S_23780 [Janthinobacterium svalbardensis]|uniref:Uncharacterized protein n=1 Tax=Janthinobacterium svalbardensis TaxID=368607 RepID=A0A290WU11_9BURK|nr:hypothetical protein [Janthinobacterium svalbardensis]ATD60395.1 hypothetical protein CNX70_09545 [Janthinobacterium svalbardensis]